MSFRSRLLILLGLVLASALCVRLGFWQLGRLYQRQAANRASLAARAEPPLSLNQSAARSPDSLADRWVTATGTYDFGHEIVVRGLAYEGNPGVNLVTPLRLGGGDTAVLVNRGFVPSPDAVRVSSEGLEEPGEAKVAGLAQAIGTGGGKPLAVDGRTTWARLDLAALRSTLPYPILPVVIRQSPDSSLPRFPRRLPPPQLDEGPHLSYAVQWFLFAAMILAFAVLVVARGTPGRRAP
jgi:surfeit locus 1 family protein